MAELSPNLISDALGQEPNAVFYSVTKSVAESLPGWAIAETQSAAFDPYAFAFDGRCTLEKRDDVFAQSLLDYEGDKNQSSLWLTHGVYDVRWNEHSLLLVIATIAGSYCQTRHCAIFAEEKQVADEFFLECCRWNSEVRGEILVFSGAWYKDPQLYESIKNATFESLILEGTLKEELIRDSHLFLDSKAVYSKHKIPWKRGILLLGPPGNGKTHAIKSLANSIGIPSLYVKSFSHPHATDQQQIQEVFKKARESAPCLLIFEDLDSLLTDGNRSFFLNEMDGFASNDGILTIATTNHPERLDPAILERPSRFDRKHTFNLPALTERLAYLAFQNESLEPELRMSNSELKQVAEITEEFSFAYLKELVLSSMMLWINQKNANMKDLMVSQVKTLLQQMKTAPPEAEYLDENDPNIVMKRYQQRWKPS